MAPPVDFQREGPRQSMGVHNPTSRVQAKAWESMTTTGGATSFLGINSPISLVDFRALESSMELG